MFSDLLFCMLQVIPHTLSVVKPHNHYGEKIYQYCMDDAIFSHNSVSLHIVIFHFIFITSLYEIDWDISFGSRHVVHMLQAFAGASTLLVPTLFDTYIVQFSCNIGACCHWCHKGNISKPTSLLAPSDYCFSVLAKNLCYLHIYILVYMYVYINIHVYL